MIGAQRVSNGRKVMGKKHKIIQLFEIDKLMIAFLAF
jgi:hypothetical protein